MGKAIFCVGIVSLIILSISFVVHFTGLYDCDDKSERGSHLWGLINGLLYLSFVILSLVFLSQHISISDDFTIINHNYPKIEKEIK